MKTLVLSSVLLICLSAAAWAQEDTSSAGSSEETVSPRDAASGLPSGKRQHKPMMAPAGDGNALDPDSDDDGLRDACDGVDDDCDSDVGDDRASDHNTRRSNRATSLGGDPDRPLVTGRASNP